MGSPYSISTEKVLKGTEKNIHIKWKVNLGGTSFSGHASCQTCKGGIHLKMTKQEKESSLYTEIEY